MSSPKADSAADAAPGWHHTHSYSSHQLQIKYEDCILAEPANGQREWAVFGIFDGHNGDAVSQLLADRILAELSKRMPGQTAPQRFDTDSGFFYAEAVRRALAGAFVAIDLVTKRDSSGRYSGAGSTATVVVQCGRLLTVANVGNSRCAVDTGCSSVELSVDDKLGNCDEELERLQEAPGVLLAQLRADAAGPAEPGEAGVGPMRVWPGGLHVSRAIGDADASPCIVPHPHIKQVILPKRATRLVMATGTVWSSFDTHHKAVSCLRGVSLQNAAAALVQKAACKWRAYNDRSVLVVDFVPEAMSCFKSQLRLDRLSRSSSGGVKPINVARFTPPINFARFTPPITFSRFTPPLVIPDLGLLRWSPGSRNSNNNSITTSANNSIGSTSVKQNGLALPPSPPPAAASPTPQTPTSPQKKRRKKGVFALFGRLACFMSQPLLRQQEQQAQQLLRLRQSRQSGAGGSGRRSGNGSGALSTCSDGPSVHGQPEEARMSVLASVDAFKVYAKGRYDDPEDVLRSIDAGRMGRPPRSLSAGDLVTLSRAAGGSVRFSWEAGSPMTSLSY